MNEPRDDLLRLLRGDRLPVEYWGGRWHWPIVNRVYEKKISERSHEDTR